MDRRLWILFLLLFALAFCLFSAVSSLAHPPQVYAEGLAQSNCIGGGTVTLTGIDPSSISNLSAVTITVIGGGFDAGAVVVLQGFSALQTTAISSTLLSANIPAGIPGGTNGRSYDVMVYNPSNPEINCAVLPDALTVYSQAATAQPTGTPEPTNTPAPTNYVRPAVTVQSYGASSTILTPGQDIDFEITLQNTGQTKARNIMVKFVSGDLIPRVTGGVQSVPDLAPGQTYRFFQPLRVDSNLWDYEAILNVEISYTDKYGELYKDTFDLSFPVYLAVSTATPTPTLSVCPDVVIETYHTDPSTLAAGNTLQLYLDLVNMSSQPARQVIIRLNLPQASEGVLAPLSSSNERYIDQLGPGDKTQINYNLAVNGDAEAGLVSIEFELSYIDNYNVQYTETETISLRIDTIPLLYVSLFTTVPDVITVGDTFELPIQVINIGQHSININTVEVTSEQLEISKGLIYLGSLDGGTSGSLTAQAQALTPGTATVLVHVNYLDAFQEPQVFIQEMTFDVQGDTTVQSQSDTGNMADGASRQMPGATQGMTVWQRIKQALLGFFGLAVQGSAGGARGMSLDG